MSPKTIAIIGGGLTGLTAAYRLSQQGFKVSLFEKENQLGGLASTFKPDSWAWPLEKYYHHFFTSDLEAKNLISELGLKSLLFFKRPKTAIYQKNTIAGFDSPLSIIQYPHLSLVEKIRLGFVTAYLKMTNNWQTLEKVTAADWLSKFYGPKTFKLIWQPLLQSKYAASWQEISMSWFWARIKKRNTRLGYLKGGFQILIEALSQKIIENNGQIYLNHPQTNLSTLKQFDRILITTPVNQLLPDVKLPPMIGVITLVLELKKPFFTDQTYWLSINEPDFPFLAVVEHTNFIGSEYYANHSILYVGGYYSPSNPLFKKNSQQIYDQFLPYLQKINPSYDFKLYTLNLKLFRDLNAQPIVPVNYSAQIPKFKTINPKVFLANMQMVYPWDRGTNYAIDIGNKVAHEIKNSF